MSPTRAGEAASGSHFGLSPDAAEARGLPSGAVFIRCLSKPAFLCDLWAVPGRPARPRGKEQARDRADRRCAAVTR